MNSKDAFLRQGRAGLVLLSLLSGCGTARADGESNADDGMAHIGSGCYPVGCRENCGPSDLPERTVCLADYTIDRREVTVGEYEACVAAGNCTAQSEEASCHAHRHVAAELPVNCVPWKDANQYCSWSGKRLPTEAEWEVAARGASRRSYPWGEEPPTCDLVISASCGNREAAQPGGTKPRGDTPEGVSDLAGNMYEYVSDWYYEVEKWKAKEKKVSNPGGPCAGKTKCKGARTHVMKGGAYWSPDELLVAWRRQAAPPSPTVQYLGFRCVKPTTPAR